MSGSFMSPTKTRWPSTASRPVYLGCRVPTLPVPPGYSTALFSRRASAAQAMESTTFLYPVQRQMFPESPSVISWRVGSGFFRTKAAAFMTMPGVQKPHWTPPFTTKPSAKAACSAGLRPSTVVRLLPSTSFIFMRQLRRGLPSTRMVQQPQTPSLEQPSLGLRMPATSRR